MCGQSSLFVDEVADEVENPIISVDIPEGGELDVSRVGETIYWGNQANVGETVRFRYTGGSQDGTRTVLVLKSDDDGLEGLTLERDGAYRRYLDNDIVGDIVIVKPFARHDEPVAVPAPVATGNVKRVRFDDAGVALLASLTGEQLAELYAKHVAIEGDGAEFDTQTGEVVVMLPAPKESKFTKIPKSDSFGGDLVITNKNEKTFSLFFYHDGTIGIHNDVNGFDNVDLSPEILRDQLVEFLA